MIGRLSIFAAFFAAILWSNLACRKVTKANTEYKFLRNGDDDSSNVDVASEEDRTFAHFSSSSGINQKMTSRDPLLGNASITFPAGALSIDTEISLEYGEDLSNSSDRAALGIASNQISSAGAPVMAVSENKSVVLSQPMQIQLPVPSSSGLVAIGDDNLVVMYRVFDHDSGKIVTGIFPRSDFEVANGKAIIKTLWWGTYQVVQLSTRVSSPVVVPSANGIKSKSGRTFLEAVPVSNSAASSGSATTSTSTSSTTATAANNTQSSGNTAGSSANSLPDTTPPANPTFTLSTPASPSNSLSFRVKGSITSDDAAAVNIYMTPNCTGNPLASGSEVDFEGQGILVSGNSNAMIAIYAQAYDTAQNLSDCVKMLDYEHDDVVPGVVTSLVSAPASPSFESNPNISGNGPGDVATVTLYSDAGCSTPIGSGSRAAFLGSGISAAVGSNQSTNIYAKGFDQAGNGSACSSSFVNYVHDGSVPSMISSLNSDIPSPNTVGNPRITGSAPSDITEVYLYSDSACTTQIAMGQRSDFLSPGFQLTVTQNSVVPIYAKTKNAAQSTSACSGLLFTFIRDNTAPDPLDSFIGRTGVGFGSVEVTLDFPSTANADSYSSIQLIEKVGTSPPVDCADGNDVKDSSNISDRTIFLTGRAPGEEYSYRFCVTDQAGNFTLSDELIGVVAGAYSVFVTSDVYNGNLKSTFDSKNFSNGLFGADYRCQYSADAVDLGGYWRALLSDDYTSLSNRIEVSLPVFNLGGAKVASDFSDLMDGSILSPISVDEDRKGTTANHVWTGSTTLGGADPANCSNWSLTSGYGKTGELDRTDGFWIDKCGSSANCTCNLSRHLYCISQKAPGLVAFSGVSGPLPNSISLSIDFPNVVTDYAKVDILRVAGPAPPNAGCSQGDVVKTYLPQDTPPFTDDAALVDLGLVGGNIYSYRACVYVGGGTLATSHTIAGVTATPSCSGTLSNGYCLYLGGNNVSCDSVCSTKGGFDLNGTDWAAASGSNCQNAVTALKGTWPGGASIGTHSSPNLGCYCESTTNCTGWVRWKSGSNATASASAVHRVCACNQ